MNLNNEINNQITNQPHVLYALLWCVVAWAKLEQMKENIWTTEKPKFTKDCWLVTFDGDGCTLWWIAKTESDDGWYWGWHDQYGEEYADIEDMEAKKYMILPYPEKYN